MTEITIIIAIFAGIGSFLAPCVLPMVPAFLAYISGSSLNDLNNKKENLFTINRTKIILNSVFFVFGFSVVFSTLGIIINGFSILELDKIIDVLNYIGGGIIVSFGIFLILSTKIIKINFEKKIIPTNKQVGYPTSFLFGLAFAVGWTPCVGPILGTILTLAATNPSSAFNLLLGYTFGLGIPFIIIGIFFSRATKIIKSMSKNLKYYNLILGSFIVILGMLVITNQLSYIANFPILNELIFLG